MLTIRVRTPKLTAKRLLRFIGRLDADCVDLRWIWIADESRPGQPMACTGGLLRVGLNERIVAKNIQ